MSTRMIVLAAVAAGLLASMVVPARSMRTVRLLADDEPTWMWEVRRLDLLASAQAEPANRSCNPTYLCGY
jgi:hypothetical protein